MGRTLAALMVGLLLLTLVACGQNTQQATQQAQPLSTQPATQATSPPAAQAAPPATATDAQLDTSIATAGTTSDVDTSSVDNLDSTVAAIDSANI